MKTILITGSTDGIGKLTAMAMAQDGHNIIIHGRSTEKLEATIAEIKDQTANSHVKGFTADLSDFNQVNALAERIRENYGKLDVLINNAGVFKVPQPKNADGLDLRFVVNYLAPYLLTSKLLPILKGGRVVNLSSAAQANVSLDGLQGKVAFDTQSVYAQSKLALTMWSFYLAHLQKEVAIIAVNPGSLLNTKMVRDGYGFHSLPASVGVKVLWEAALSQDFANASGKYFDNDRGAFSPAHPDSYDWEKIIGLIQTTDALLSTYL